MRSVGWLGAIFAVLAAKPALAQQAPAGEVAAEVRERGALLAQHLPDAVARRSLPLLSPVIIAASGTMAGLGVTARSPGLIAGGAVGVLGGVTFYLMPEDRNYELLFATTEASVGFYYLGLPFDAPNERWQIPVGAAFLATSALGFINTAYSTNPGRSRLAADLARVRTPAARSSLTANELLQIEKDLYGTDPFVPRWAMGLPLMAGAVVAAIPLFDRDVARRDKPVIGTFAALAMLQGLTFSLTPTVADDYRTSLQRAGLWAKWGVGPGGISVVGGFD